MGEGLQDNENVYGAVGPSTHPLSTYRHTWIVLILSVLLAVLLLTWSTWEQIRTRQERERALAVQTTRIAADKLTEFLRATDKRLADFVAQEQGLLDDLIAAPESTDLRDRLWSRLRRHFPPHAMFALVLNGGGWQIAGLGDYLDADDKRLLRRFSRGESPTLRFAVREGVLFARFAASWRDGKTPVGSLALCLRCGELCLPDTLPVPPGHKLRLIADPAATPATAAYTRDSATALAALAKAPLEDSGWMLVDQLEPQFAAALLRDRLVLVFGLGAVLLLAVVLLGRWIRSRNNNILEEWSDLRESRRMLQAILSVTTDGIILTDLAGRIEVFNRVAEKMFNCRSDDALKTKVFSLLPEILSSQSAVSLGRRVDPEHAPPVVHETQGRRKGGRVFPVRLWVSSVRRGDKGHLIIVVRDLTEHERNVEKLAFLEQRDVLTGLLNRREFERRLTSLLADPGSSLETPYVICHIDVDRFKLINDTCGHEAGDELLRQLAILINTKLDLAQIIGRFGGDEFVVLFQNRHAEEAGEICDGLAQTVRNFLFTWSDQSFDVAISMGLAEFTPARESPSSALSKADVACHMAKAHGRARIHIYHEGDVELVRHHGDMHLVSAISQALSDGRFHLYAQPIVPLTAANSERRHFEVLVRMIDENGAMMIPEQFIPAAERYILMPALDRWIVNRLFSLQAENLRAWHHIAPESFLFAINLSGTSISDEGFLRYLKRLFAEWDVPYQSICFEITETAAVSDLQHARAFMQELTALGCSFSLDDFGTGLSSYSYLKELPVDYLKIDGSFVRDMAGDPVNRALVESIVHIGHVLGLETIAEWVEDTGTLAILRKLNVDFAQGFIVGEPLSVSTLTLADAAIPPAVGAASEDAPRSSQGSGRERAMTAPGSIVASPRDAELES